MPEGVEEDILKARRTHSRFGEYWKHIDHLRAPRATAFLPSAVSCSAYAGTSVSLATSMWRRSPGVPITMPTLRRGTA